MVATELLTLLLRHAGREYRVDLIPAYAPTSKQKKVKVATTETQRHATVYLFTVRGEHIEATGPSGHTRLLSPKRFVTLFAGATFGLVEPTGRLSDLGPLFAETSPFSSSS